MSDQRDGKMRIEEVPLHMILGSATKPLQVKKKTDLKAEKPTFEKSRERLRSVLFVLDELDTLSAKMTVEQKMQILVNL